MRHLHAATTALRMRQLHLAPSAPAALLSCTAAAASSAVVAWQPVRSVDAGHRHRRAIDSPRGGLTRSSHRRFTSHAEAPEEATASDAPIHPAAAAASTRASPIVGVAAAAAASSPVTASSISSAPPSGSPPTAGPPSSTSSSTSSSASSSSSSSSVVTRYACVVEYHGSHYHGWSPSGERDRESSVAGALEVAISHLCSRGQTPIRIVGSGRTDRGVHAVGQVFHVDIDRELMDVGGGSGSSGRSAKGRELPVFTPLKFQHGVNHFLRALGHSRIQLLAVSIVPARLTPSPAKAAMATLTDTRAFHARYSAISRAYVYTILASPHLCSVFHRDRAWHVRQPLDLPAMRRALDHMRGVHDFSVFRASGCASTHAVRDMVEARLEVQPVDHGDWSWRQMHQQEEGHALSLHPQNSSLPAHSFPAQLIHVHFRSRSFLYHQIRNLVGGLVQVGRGVWHADMIETFLRVDAQRLQTDPEHQAAYRAHRKLVGNFQAPAQGLCLREVVYPYELDDWTTKQLRPTHQQQAAGASEASDAIIR